MSDDLEEYAKAEYEARETDKWLESDSGEQFNVWKAKKDQRLEFFIFIGSIIVGLIILRVLL